MGSEFRTTVIACTLAAGLAACAAAPRAPLTAVEPAGTTTTASAQKAKGADADNGYRRVTRSGTVYFCKKEGYTGSRVAATETCLTEAQMERQRQNTLDFMSRTRGDPGYTGPTNAQGGAMIGPMAH
jgi:hypothetical protein